MSEEEDQSSGLQFIEEQNMTDKSSSKPSEKQSNGRSCTIVESSNILDIMNTTDWLDKAINEEEKTDRDEVKRQGQEIVFTQPFEPNLSYIQNKDEEYWGDEVENKLSNQSSILNNESYEQVKKQIRTPSPPRGSIYIMKKKRSSSKSKYSCQRNDFTSNSYHYGSSPFSKSGKTNRFDSRNKPRYNNNNKNFQRYRQQDENNYANPRHNYSYNYQSKKGDKYEDNRHDFQQREQNYQKKYEEFAKVEEPPRTYDNENLYGQKDMNSTMDAYKYWNMSQMQMQMQQVQAQAQAQMNWFQQYWQLFKYYESLCINQNPYAFLPNQSYYPWNTQAQYPSAYSNRPSQPILIEKDIAQPEKVVSAVPKNIGKICFPKTEIIINNCLLSITCTKISRLSADILMVPYYNSQFTLYPFIKLEQYWNSKQLIEKNTQALKQNLLRNGEGIKFQTQISSFKAIAFVKVANPKEESFLSSFNKGITNLLSKEAANAKSIVIPYISEFGSTREKLNKITEFLQLDNTHNYEKMTMSCQDMSSYKRLHVSMGNILIDLGAQSKITF